MTTTPPIRSRGPGPSLVDGWEQVAFDAITRLRSGDNRTRFAYGYLSQAIRSRRSADDLAAILRGLERGRMAP